MTRLRWRVGLGAASLALPAVMVALALAMGWLNLATISTPPATLRHSTPRPLALFCGSGVSNLPAMPWFIRDTADMNTGASVCRRGGVAQVNRGNEDGGDDEKAGRDGEKATASHGTSVVRAQCKSPGDS